MSLVKLVFLPKNGLATFLFGSCSPFLYDQNVIASVLLSKSKAKDGCLLSVVLLKNLFDERLENSCIFSICRSLSFSCSKYCSFLASSRNSFSFRQARGPVMSTVFHLDLFQLCRRFCNVVTNVSCNQVTPE